MYIKRLYILLVFILVGMGIGYAQTSNTKVYSGSRSTAVLPPPTALSTSTAEPWRHLYIKTNGIAWAMGITNIAAEIVLDRRWSVALPIYYSGWNYLKYTQKFRTFTLQPEVRYWINAVDNNGLYAAAHLGLGWYNVALNGDYRIQDHGGNSPAFGGGVSAGYRLPFKHSKRWSIEFSLGVGVYGVHYDKFSNCKNGLLTETKSGAWVGIDQAAATIVYTLDLKKKGGAQ